MKNTILDFKLGDDTVLKMTLNYAQLYKLRAQNKSLYERYSKIIVKGAQDEFDNLTVLYTAYACANLDKALITEMEFIERMTIDREYIANSLQALMGQKKK